MTCLIVLQVLCAVGPVLPPGESPDKIIGMYVHQHWSYNHPYAARTWTLEDWRGYIDGIHRLGYNTVMIWPVLETMPNPLTDSDRENLDKIASVIDMLHNEFGMKAYVTLAPNVIARNDVAAQYTFQDRPFFYCDARVNPADAAAMSDMMAWRESLFRPLAAMDGVVIIDSDPGGYPGSVNGEFVDLLAAHRAMLDRLRPGIEVVYWMHAGWEAYCRYYATGAFAMGSDEETIDVVRLLAARNLEPWGLTGGRLAAMEGMGESGRMFSFPYGAIEGEPSFPMTNFGGDGTYKTGGSPGPRGIMGNAQSHCLQLPNTFAFARGAQGLSCAEADYVCFAEDLIPGQGAAIVAAWKALAGTDVEEMRAAEAALSALTAEQLTPGPLQGLLFGDPPRFVRDLVLQLRLRAALEEFHKEAFAEAVAKGRLASRFARFIEAAEAWQQQHNYKNNWYWPRMEEALRKLEDGALSAALDARSYTGEGATPFEQVQDGFRKVECYTPGLLAAMREALGRMEVPRFNPRVEAITSHNLIRNASFECGGDGWSSLGKTAGWGGDLSGLYGVIEAGGVEDGGHCLRIDLGPGVTPVSCFDVWPPAWERQHAPLAANVGWMTVPQGEPVTLSAWMKSSLPGTKARFLFRFAKNALEPIQEASHEVTLTTEWARYTVTQPVLNEDVCIALGPDMTSQPDATVSVWLDAVQLETGPAASPQETREPVELGISTDRYGNVFTLDQPIGLVLRGDNRSAEEVSPRVALELEDYFGTALPPQTLQVDIPPNGRSETRWAVSVPGRGHYRARAVWTANGKEHTRPFTFTVIEAYPHEDSPFGLNHPAPTEGQLRLLSRAGIRWVRNWSVNWDWVEPEPGRFTWEAQDKQFAHMASAKMNPLVVFPNPSARWASTAPASVSDSMWYRLAYAPADPELLYRFLGSAVERYRSACTHWEFLNEPLWVPDFCLPKKGGYTVPDYVKLLEGAYRAIKAADPESVVIGGIANEPDATLAEEFIAAGGLQYCDILNLHPYGRMMAPEAFIKNLERIQRAMDASGKAMPIWATETAYYGVDDKPWTPWEAPPDHFSAGLLLADEREAADYIVRHALILLAHGVEKIFYHEPIEGPVNNNAWDIENTFLTPDGVPKKSYAVLSALANRLGPAPRYAGRLDTAEKDRVYGFAFHCGGRAVLAAWAASAEGETKTAMLVVPEAARAYDILGNPLRAEQVVLSTSPVYLESDSLAPEALLAACTPAQ